MTQVQGRRQVVVTGFGVVSPVGTGPEEFWAGLLEPGPDRQLRRVDGFDPSPWFSPREIRHHDRFTQLAVAAAGLAVAHAGGMPEVEPGRRGVHLGTGLGGLGAFEEQVGVLLARGPDRVSPYALPMLMPNAAAAAVALRHGARGPVETLVTACAAGTHSVAAGARLVADGRCDVVLAGGAEAPLTPTTVAGFSRMTALSPGGRSQPFDAERDGFCLGEGAAVLVLEERTAALARGATLHGEVLGSGSTCDAHHVTAPAPGGSGAAACMRMALADAGLEPRDVRAVNAHGTSTPLNDAAEAAAIVDVLGAHTVPVTSIKGATGHALGAAGAVEAVSVLLSFAQRALPPTLGTTRIEPALAIDVVLRDARAWEPGPVLSNSFGFGGHNGSVVLAPS